MRLLLFLCSGMLLIALASMPIGYYTILRFVVTIGAVAVIIYEFDGEITPLIIAFGLIAIIFNPFIPVYLHDRELWAVIDIIAAVLFGYKGLRWGKDNKVN